MKKKRVLVAGIVAAAVLGAAATVVTLNVKTVRVAEGLSCRVVFGKISDAEARRVLEAADRDLMAARKYRFARDAYVCVATRHGGEWRDEAYLGVARTYLAEGNRAEAHRWLGRIIKEYPKGSAVEGRKFDAAVTSELGKILDKPPLAYGDAVKYLALLNAAGSPDAPAWREKMKGIVETPFTLSASYSHEKELAYVVRETATKDARNAALFYARENVPAELLIALKARVNFGGVLNDAAALAFINERAVYADSVDKVTAGAKDEIDVARSKMEDERKKKGLGELPEEWANAFLMADDDKGWVASASVKGKLENVTIADFLTYGGVDPFTGAPVRK